MRLDHLQRAKGTKTLITQDFSKNYMSSKVYMVPLRYICLKGTYMAASKVIFSVTGDVKHAFIPRYYRGELPWWLSQ